MKILVNRAYLWLTLILFVASCHPRSHCIETNLCYTPLPPRVMEPFSPYTQQEKVPGREIEIGAAFEKEGDYYRAITCYKRALIELPEGLRKSEVEYRIFRCYVLGEKFSLALDFFKRSGLPHVSSAFPAFRDLILLLYTVYERVGDWGCADEMQKLMEKGDPETASILDRYAALAKVDFCDKNEIYPTYLCQRKSVCCARSLNAILPGAGYLYVGQKQTALTAFVMNSLFIAAAYEFFSRGYVAAGLITSSFELGWYFGGINGAGLAAKYYNERLYHRLAMNHCRRERLFPLLHLNFTF